MLTSRGWTILVVIFLMLASALLDRYIFTLLESWGLMKHQDPRVLFPSISLELLGLTLGLWFVWEWLLFSVRVR